MTKRILATVILLVSPFASLMVFTPISVIPAFLLSIPFTRNDCANIHGESLCGMGVGFLITFMLNAVIGLYITRLICLRFLKTWDKKNEKYFTLALALYFVVVISLFLYLTILKPGYLN